MAASYDFNVTSFLSSRSICSASLSALHGCSEVASFNPAVNVPAVCGLKKLQFSTTPSRSGIHKEWSFERKRSKNLVRSSSAKSKGNITMNSDSPVNSESYDYIPQAEFYKVEAILRPWRLPHVASALLKSGIRGVTVSDVRGFGAQGGSRERQAGSEFTEDSFVTKVKLEIVVSKDQVEVVIETIIDQARTGEIGDGKIFVLPVADVIRIRTGERGIKAERMAGGRTELLSTMN